jgi:hypothetical protein
MIRFGSRVDLVLPKEKVEVKINLGLNVKAAENCLASVVGNET